MTTLPKKICFVDIETTGMSLNNDRILEVGVLRVEDGKLVDTFNSLINPQTYIPPEIEILTGITKIDVESAPTFYQIKNDLKKILEDCVFVAHNVRFDFSFLKTEFKRFDLEFNPKHFCTVKLSRALFPQHHHHNLDSLISRYGFVNEKRHRAFDDAKVLWEFYQMVLQNFEEEKVLEAISRGMKRPTVPLNLQMEYLEGLPDAPGVYIFYGDNNLPIYIGKSVSIRKRVMNHFSSDHLSSIELKIAQQVKHVEHIVTSGELGALLKESYMIKKMQPIYNRKLRQSKKLIAVRSMTQQDGYLSVEFIDAGEIDVTNLDSIIGVFKSKRAAQTFLLNKCKEFQLCEKFLGLDHTSGGCFQYRLGKCKGGCAGKELPVMYNFRFQRAFYENRLKKWPFSTPILIEEKGLVDGKSESFVLDKWCLLGSVSQDGQDKNVEIKRELEFDLDTYKILNNFLKSKKVQVRPINMEQLSFF